MAMSNFHGVTLLLLLLLLLSDLLQAILADSSPGDVPLPLLRLPLHREVVPIHRKGKFVSNKISFSGSLSIGQPPQMFRAVMDTGSGHVIVPSEGCQSKSCSLHRRYNLSASTTGTAINADGSKVENSDLTDQLTIGFGTGEVLGEFAKERVCLANNITSGRKEAGEPSCVDVNIVTAVEMSEQPFSTFSFDGILGLSLKGLAFSPEFSFFQALASRTADPGRRQFAFFLTDEDEEASSQLIIGGHDSAHTLDPLSWVPVTLPDMGFWQLQIKTIRVSGVELDFCRSGDCRGVFDTGTSHLGVPAPFDQELLQLLTVPEASLGAQTDDIDCRLATTPVLQIEVDGLNLTLEPQHYMRKMPLRKDVRLSESGGVVAEPEGKSSRLRRTLKLPNTAASNERFCRPRLMPVKLPAPLGPKLFLFGEPLLQRYYTVFDWESQKIGLSLSANRRNIAAQERAEADKRRAEEERAQRQRQRREEMKSRPRQVDEIILLQLPKKASLSKTRVAEDGEECDEDETCSAGAL